jgi:hypothetical protein
MLYIYPRERVHIFSVIITIKSNYSFHNITVQRDFLFCKIFDLEQDFSGKEYVIFTELEDVLKFIFC